MIYIQENCKELEYKNKCSTILKNAENNQINRNFLIKEIEKARIEVEHYTTKQALESYLKKYNPNKLTISKCASLNKKLKKRILDLRRSKMKWELLLERAFKLEDIIFNKLS